MRRVAITGVGPVTPVGTGRDELWASLVAGRSGIGPLTRFDASSLTSRIAGQIDDFDCSESLSQQKSRKAERFTHLAFEGARLALDDADLRVPDLEPGRVGVVIGSAYGGTSRLETEIAVLLSKGLRAVPPEINMSCAASSAAAFVSMEFGFLGPVECLAAACASGAQAIARGSDLVMSGRADVVLAGGTDAALTPLSMAAFCSARALSRRNDAPTAASRPFERDRDGFVFSEGSAILVLEDLASASARGAPVLAEVLGYAHSQDGHSLVAPHPSGEGAVRSMTSALADAGVAPIDVGYVNAHAASTPIGDVAEARALQRVFGRVPPPVSSTKSMTGHLLGAAGALEAAATALAIHSGQLPPTINVTSLDPQCELDVIPNQARAATVDVAISNSFGLGGLMSTLVLARY
ncbi:beta-ketoacyl-[acyl-carrier-protein] synthase family protein [Streptomyces sp. NPDC057301]|uniref:beta-ketoacyl-[acyl-carrier-protein] synthase family protein n=1 Tax=Streptomyces sp. NPDC057301 TaxID=3346093 RepID=UPI003642FF2F